LLDDARLEALGFVPEWDATIPYMARSRDWYLALGYGNPYVWAHHTEVPFQRLQRPLSESRVTLVTTAAPYAPDKGDQGPGAPYNSAAKFYEVYARRTDEDTICASLMSQSTASTPRRPIPARGSPCRRCATRSPTGAWVS
jgi:hypothetical protein